jgi:hypothetical protein
MAERCRRKRGVKFSAVFATVRFRIVLSVFSENAESNFAFSAKARSQTKRCRRKCGVKLCAFGNLQRIQRRSKIMGFRRIRGVKRGVFAKNAEWNGAFSAITLYSRKSGYVLGFNTYFNKTFLHSGPQPCLLLNDAKKLWKTNYKISCMCTFKQLFRKDGTKSWHWCSLIFGKGLKHLSNTR